MPSAWRTGCAHPGRRSTSRRDEALQLSESSATASPTRCAWPSGSAAKPSRSRAAPQHRGRRHRAMRRRTTSPRSSSANRTRSRWFEILHGSVVHDLVRRAGDISVHVIAGDDDRGEPVPKKTVANAARQPALRTRSLCRGAAGVAVALGVGQLVQPWFGHRERRPRLPDGRRRASPSASACCHRSSPSSRRRSPTISSSCRRSTRSRSLTRRT